MWPSKININQKDGVLSEHATQDEIQEERPSSSADAGVAASDSDWSDDEDGQQPGESFQEWEARMNFPPGVTRPSWPLSDFQKVAPGAPSAAGAAGAAGAPGQKKVAIAEDEATIAANKQPISQEEKHAIAEFLARKEEEQRIKKRTEEYAKMMEKHLQDWFAKMQ